MKIPIHGLTTLAVLPVMLGVWGAMAQAANTVYVGASYGLYKSTDAGATWTMVDIPLNNPLLKAKAPLPNEIIEVNDAPRPLWLEVARHSAVTGAPGFIAVFNATKRSRRVSRAFHTAPMPPSPSFDSMR